MQRHVCPFCEKNVKSDWRGGGQFVWCSNPKCINCVREGFVFSIKKHFYMSAGTMTNHMVKQWIEDTKPFYMSAAGDGSSASENKSLEAFPIRLLFRCLRCGCWYAEVSQPSTILAPEAALAAAATPGEICDDKYAQFIANTHSNETPSFSNVDAARTVDEEPTCEPTPEWTNSEYDSWLSYIRKDAEQNPDMESLITATLSRLTKYLWSHPVAASFWHFGVLVLVLVGLSLLALLGMWMRGDFR